MTIKEAKAMFSLKESDKLNKLGIKSLIDSTNNYLKVWSISKYDRAKAEKEIEALTILLKAAK